MVYGSFQYDNRRDHRDYLDEEEEAFVVIHKGRDDGSDAADDADDDEESNNIMIATANSTRFKVAYIPFLLLMVVLSCIMLGIDFGFGTITFSSLLLSSSPSSSLSLSLSSSAYNNNNIDEAAISSTQQLDSVAIATNDNIGRCQTTGSYSSVVTFNYGDPLHFGTTYWGLSFNANSYSKPTLNPDRCYWENSQYHNEQCPPYDGSGVNTFHFVDAWQQCAEACNKDESCITYTAKTNHHYSRPFHCDRHYSYTCYLHDHFKCNKAGTGVAASDIHVDDIKKDDDRGYGVWSGFCRSQDCTKSGTGVK